MERLKIKTLSKKIIFEEPEMYGSCSLTSQIDYIKGNVSKAAYKNSISKNASVFSSGIRDHALRRGPNVLNHVSLQVHPLRNPQALLDRVRLNLLSLLDHAHSPLRGPQMAGRG